MKSLGPIQEALPDANGSDKRNPTKPPVRFAAVKIMNDGPVSVAETTGSGAAKRVRFSVSA